LKVASATRRSIARKSAGAIFASVVMKESIVAMLGSIMPAPFAMPWMRTRSAPRRRSTQASFAKVSVVRMASAACPMPSLASSAAASGMPRFRISSGSG
jgi:hypothetical protein